jgi:hypothetical protein
MPESITCLAWGRRGLLAFLAAARGPCGRKLRVVALLLSASSLVACRGSTVEAPRSGLILRTLPDCAPDRVERLVVEPLGDFALPEPAAVARDLDQDLISISGLPGETAWFRLRVETPDPGYHAFALAPAGEPDEPLDALVLPLTRTCSVQTEAFQQFDESTLAMVAAEDLLLAGGLARGDVATRAARLLRVARTQLEPDARGLDVPRAQASGLMLAAETWVIGGAFERRAGAAALDTFDRYDAATRGFVGLGRMRIPRVRPATLSLLDGSALVAGGSATVDGEPLTSIEGIAADGDASAVWPDALPFAASDLGLFVRDDGNVLALGLADGESALAQLDPGTRRVEPLEGPPLRADALLRPELTTSLPGGRLAMLELDGPSGRTTGSAFIMFPEDGSYLEIADPRDDSDLTWLASFSGIEHGRVLGLADGRILLTGVRQDLPLARLLDPGRRDVATRALDIVVDRLFARADGSVLMVGSEGARILREDEHSAYDNPGGNLLADDSGVLCVDAFGRFAREGLGLRATVNGARFDLVPLRYRDVRFELTVDGPAVLGFTRNDGGQRTIAVGTDSVGPAYCKLSVTAGEPLEIERREERVTLRSGQANHSCQLDGMTGSIAVFVRALAPDVLIRDLRATRL